MRTRVSGVLARVRATDVRVCGDAGAEGASNPVCVCVCLRSCPFCVCCGCGPVRGFVSCVVCAAAVHAPHGALSSCSKACRVSRSTKQQCLFIILSLKHPHITTPMPPKLARAVPHLQAPSSQASTLFKRSARAPAKHRRIRHRHKTDDVHTHTNARAQQPAHAPCR